jgi:hypothetical protein
MSKSICPWQAFTAWCNFGGKARSLPFSGVPERMLHSYIKLGWKVEGLAKEEHSNLLQKISIKDVKSFIT